MQKPRKIKPKKKRYGENTIILDCTEKFFKYAQQVNEKEKYAINDTYFGLENPYSASVGIGKS